MSRPDSLIGVVSKIERANQHIAELSPLTDGFLGRQPYGPFVEIDPVNGNHLTKVRAIQEPPPPEIAVICGEILYLLRSALDHLVTQVASIKNASVIKRTGFPIEETLEKFESVLHKRKIEARLPVLAALLRELKPYKGGNDLLWWLHWLNGREKHQTLVPIAGSKLMRGIKLDVSVATDRFPEYPIIHTGWFRLDEDHTVLTLPPEGKGESQVELDLNISFGDVEALQFQPIQATLQQFSDLTTGIVASFEERFFGS